MPAFRARADAAHPGAGVKTLLSSSLCPKRSYAHASSFTAQTRALTAEREGGTGDAVLIFLFERKNDDESHFMRG
ncbi:MAG: hypothetical protein J6E31_01260, partial [Pyramidobacter sp.]|nr:hypothetical protein [Pyramidobacter sp.]